jgi:hypothetical protein
LEGPCPREVALAAKQERQAVEALRRTGMLRASLFMYRQRALEEQPRAREVALVLKKVAKSVEMVRCSEAELCSLPLW